MIANTMGMSNVCLVPMSYIILRGQGAKIFSLVAKYVRDMDFVMPVIKPPQSHRRVEDDGGGATAGAGYEGAVVLDPEPGVYMDQPVVVMDYASLYPSSMISENISHDTLVMDPKYADVPGFRYNVVRFDVYSGTGDARVKVREEVCRFAEPERPGPDGLPIKGVLPRILQELLHQRKVARARAKEEVLVLDDGSELIGIVSPERGGDGLEVRAPGPGGALRGGGVVPAGRVRERRPAHDAFSMAVLDGLQLAYKVTANSLYGQVGATTSPISLKRLAASTTAVGRQLIHDAKAFMEARGARVVYGDTDSVFVTFPDEAGGRDLASCIRHGEAESAAFSCTLKAPHHLEYEKTYHPFIILSKKRYCANQYGTDAEASPKRSTMGIVLKRRDQAVGLIQEVYGKAIDMILNQRDVVAAFEHVLRSLSRVRAGEYPMEWFVVTKTLGAHYKARHTIAHAVLADRVNARAPGSVNVGDRIAYVFVVMPPCPANVGVDGRPVKKCKVLQGERIETLDYARANNLSVDYDHYITNQLKTPIVQLFALVAEQLPCYDLDPGHFDAMASDLRASGDAAWRAKVLRAREKYVQSKLL